MSVPSLSPSSSSSSLSIDRPNEHLAVLLPKQLWKVCLFSFFGPPLLLTAISPIPLLPPATTFTVASHLPCLSANTYVTDLFTCYNPAHLTYLQHCRKCGGVFCGACTSRTTPLLDASNLEILQPPRNMPISAFESPISPIVDSRVCDDCWDQIHGCPTTPHTPDVIRPSFKRVLSHPITLLKFPLSPNLTTPAQSTSSSPILDDILSSNFKPRSQSLRNTPSVSSFDTQSSSTSNPNTSRRVVMRSAHLPLPQDLERSYGELDAYPLRRSSLMCKATGGGRWEPKQSPVLDGYRHPVPGGKAPFELEMEREEMIQRRQRQNLVKDGPFQYRLPIKQQSQPSIPMSRSPFNLSTF